MLRGWVYERKNNSPFVTKGWGWGATCASMMQHVANIHSTLGKAAKKAEPKHPLTENSFYAKVYLKILVSHQSHES